MEEEEIHLLWFRRGGPVDVKRGEIGAREAKKEKKRVGYR